VQLKDCPFCQKPIPAKITACPYCHRDEQGQPVRMDTSAAPPETADSKYFDSDLADLANPDPFLREQATVRMAQKGFGVAQALISILADHSKPGLAGVAKVLGRIRDRRAIPVLLQAMKMGDEDLRLAAIWSLGQFQEPEVLNGFIGEAERQHPGIQSYVAYLLGGFHDASALPALTKLMKHPSREVAFQAAFALGELGDARAIPALQKTLRRKDPVIRAAASASIRRLGATPQPPALRLFWIVLPLILAAAAAAFWYFRRG
jgi:HEAT repeat protein